MAERFFYEGALNGRVILEGAEHSHLSVILRAKSGDKVILFNGDGNDYFGTVATVNKRTTEIDINGCATNPCNPRISFTLFQAIPKGDKLEMIMQKMTELGANAVVPIITRFCTAKKESVKLERLRKIAIEAAKQCGRATIPAVSEPIQFARAVERFAEFDAVFMPYEKEQKSTFADAFYGLGSARKIALVIGSEGGIDGEEAELGFRRGAKLLTLGERILRLETASIAATSVIMNFYGEFSR